MGQLMETSAAVVTKFDYDDQDVIAKYDDLIVLL